MSGLPLTRLSKLDTFHSSLLAGDEKPSQKWYCVSRSPEGMADTARQHWSDFWSNKFQVRTIPRPELEKGFTMMAWQLEFN